MPIIEPKKEKSKIKYVIFGLILAASFGAYVSILLYNGIVNLRHGISESEEEISRLEAANADLKNKLYSVTEIENLKLLGSKSNLIPDRKPEFIKFSADDLANKQ